MNQQSVVEAPETPTNGLVGRVAQLEAEMAELKALVRRASPSPYRPRCPVSYKWLELPDHLKDGNRDSQIDPEDLVHIHELTHDDVRHRLDELEQWYGIYSEVFYQLWRRGEADDIFEKTEWSMLYESWLEAQSALSQAEKVIA